MSDHYVRHMLSNGDTVRTQFECRAPEDGRCRSVCKKCQSFAHSCDCRPFAEPILVTGEPCGVLPFLEEESEYCYGGDDDEPVRAGWNPISLDWDGDGYTWHYDEDLPETPVVQV